MPMSSQAKRKPTRPSRAAKAKRVDEKKRRGAVKAGARKGEAGLMYDFKIEAADKATLYPISPRRSKGWSRASPTASPTWPMPRR